MISSMLKLFARVIGTNLESLFGKQIQLAYILLIKLGAAESSWDKIFQIGVCLAQSWWKWSIICVLDVCNSVRPIFGLINKFGKQIQLAYILLTKLNIAKGSWIKFSRLECAQLNLGGNGHSIACWLCALRCVPFGFINKLGELTTNFVFML